MFNDMLRLALVLLCVQTTSAWGGVTAERTRVIFEQGQRENSLALVNQNSYPVIVQTWIDDGAPDSAPDMANAPFMPLPPVFRLNAGQQRSLRLLYTGQPLPDTRESLYWLNLYEMPPQDAAPLAEGQARLTVTLRTQMKVIYRPAALKAGAEEAPRALAFKREGTGVRVENPTAYFITLTGARVGEGASAVTLPGDLLPPFSTRLLKTANATAVHSTSLDYVWLDDGGNAQQAQAQLQ